MAKTQEELENERKRILEEAERQQDQMKAEQAVARLFERKRMEAEIKFSSLRNTLVEQQIATEELKQEVLKVQLATERKRLAEHDQTVPAGEGSG